MFTGGNMQFAVYPESSGVFMFWFYKKLLTHEFGGVINTLQFRLGNANQPMEKQLQLHISESFGEWAEPKEATLHCKSPCPVWT